MWARQLQTTVLTLVSSVAATAALAQTPAAPAPAAPAAAAPTTLWSFLGCKAATCAKLKASKINAKGCHPEKEKKPLLKAIADPENLQSKNAAIQTAAQVKTEEDLARQKIKAIKYLGAMGCGCYPGVKEALLAALDDCTEEVRFAAAVALIQAAGGCCGMQDSPPPPRGLFHLYDCPEEPQPMTCGCGKTCCDEEVRKKLVDVAFEQTGPNCWKEPSARVRGAAAQALAMCDARPTPAKESDRTVPGPEVIPVPNVPETAPNSTRESAPQPLPPSDGSSQHQPNGTRGKRNVTSAPKAQPMAAEETKESDYSDYYNLGDSPTPPTPAPEAATAAAEAPAKSKVAETVKTSHSERLQPTRSARLQPIRSASSKALGIY